MTKSNKPIKHIGVIVRPQTPELKKACLDIFNTFSNAGIMVSLEMESSVMLGLKDIGVCFKDMLGKIDALVSIGGDGTLLYAVQKSLGSGLSVCGINMGWLGFLTAIKPSELIDFIDILKSGTYTLDTHYLLKALIDSANKTPLNNTPLDEGLDMSSKNVSMGNKSTIRCVNALNDVFLTKKDSASMVRIYARINGVLVNTYRADGLIIATPTGSTAYNISAGGSVVHPRCRVLLLTPVCAHSLTQRPMVVSDDLELEFSLEDDGVAIFDGQEQLSLKQGEVLRICSGDKINLIQHPKRNYFAVLNEKFHWGGGV